MIISYIGFGIIVAIFIPLLIRWYIRIPQRKGKFISFFILFACFTFFAYLNLFCISAQYGYDLLNMTNKPIIIYIALFTMPFVPIILCLYFESKKL